MDVFKLHRDLIAEYGSFSRSFVDIRDERIAKEVADAIQGGVLWPAPRIQVNPQFAPGGTADDLVDQGILHPECARIFRVKSDPNDSGRPLRFYEHQVQAIEAARRGDSYVLTTGTGSGKSLAFMVPIVDHVLREGSGQGLRAIVVYPMNALANSQLEELKKFLHFGYPPGRPPVTFARYTGQESDDERELILGSPPDLLLTNYVMLELILTRPREREKLIRSAHGKLRFLVLDELHTYRGRQGADVAMLVRRVRDAAGVPDLQCVGTSATLLSGESEVDSAREVAAVASTLFGSEVKPENIIGETLTRATPEVDLHSPAVRDAIIQVVIDRARSAPTGHDEFLRHPFSSWIESTLGIYSDTTGRLVRHPPRPIDGPDGAAGDLAAYTGLPQSDCADAISGWLLASYRASHSETGQPAFAFRLHQFITKGNTVYGTLEPEDQRYVTLEGQKYRPGHPGTVLLPLVFCRECGQEYYVVTRTPQGEFLPRDLGDQAPDDTEGGRPGFLHVDTNRPWPAEPEEVLERLPETWKLPDGSIDPSRRRELPQRLVVAPDGREAPEGVEATWIPAPFRFCLNCGISYDPTLRSDFTKLSFLSAGGRSTAASVLSLSLIRGMRNDPTLRHEAKKLLGFTDNRQDASLQAGHFNDYVEVGLLRGALYRVVAEAGEAGVSHDVLPQRVFEALNLPLNEYASDPEVRFAARRRTDEAFRDVIAYRIWADLERGWRVTMPNLEQCGLLEIDYEGLDELAADRDIWRDCHPTLLGASPETREKISRVLLDHLRRRLAINVRWLDPNEQEALRQRALQNLSDRWTLDERERLRRASTAFPRSRRRGDWREYEFVSGRGAFGRWLRKTGTFPNLASRLTVDDTDQIIRDLFEKLRLAGLVEVAVYPESAGDVPGYQVKADAMRFRVGGGSRAFFDPIRTPDRPETDPRTNSYFVRFYREVARDLVGLEAREHTAQVPAEVRMDREKRFREAQLPVLYASPTMELGVDIAELNAVYLRNVPPTPANYAQRSGRAGRSGQPALIVTYCAPGSPHDQYFFRRSRQMVAGAVSPPRLDVANEELVRAHIHAIWLAETGITLGRSMRQVLDLEAPGYPLHDDVRAAIASEPARQRTWERARRLLDSIADELADVHWYSDGWLDETIAHIELEFDRACDRWRDLYRAASEQAKAQTAIIQDPSASRDAKNRAKRLRAEAESQMDLLTSDSTDRYQSDFYPYRYLASEGFLPGYSFPRLPLSAFVPGRRGRDDYLSRPRFLAISEFGPGALVYHEGSRYQIERIILPAERADHDGDLPLATVKQCTECGYVHHCQGNAGPDLCDHCGAMLGAPLRNLLRMQNVVTRRRERINSDEEERQRVGYEIRTGLRFAEGGARPGIETGTIVSAGREVGKLTYGHAATIWRINLGWRRRKERDRYGYPLDLDTGRWLKEQDLVGGDEDLPALDDARRVERVVPYVEDRRNCLIFEPAEPLSVEEHASLMAALKSAIQVHFQLEDDELAAEPLPDADNRNSILFYEAAEGGAGVLRRLLREPQALAVVARTALEICHFDPVSGEDRHRAPGARQDCEAACYDCLMSYTNQLDHRLLDRSLAKDMLAVLTRATVNAAPGGRTRAEHLADLRRACDSDLERAWLDLLEAHNLRLPSHAQRLIETCSARPDFSYESSQTVIFIDGPHHDATRIAERDEQVVECLEDLGYTVIRFRYDDQDGWLDTIRQFPSVFGEVR